MIFQGKEFPTEEVRKAYEEAMIQFRAFGIQLLSFDDWVQYNNDYFENKEKALDKWVRKSPSNKKRRKSHEEGN